MKLFNSIVFVQDMSKSDVTRIISVTLLMYTLVYFVRVSFLMNNTEDAFFIENFWNKLCISSNVTVQSKQLWSIITYMFMHNSIISMLSSMVWVWIFAGSLEDNAGKNASFIVYIIGGIIGALCMLGFHSFFSAPTNESTLYYTPQAATMALAIASTLYAPRFIFFQTTYLKVPLYVFTLLYIVLCAVTNTTNSSMWCITVGGALVGLLHQTILKSFFALLRTKITTWGNMFWDNSFFMQKNKVK